MDKIILERIERSLFIIDDCSAEGEINKKRDALSELAFSGRYRNHFLWVLTQKYNSVSKDVREQINPISTGLFCLIVALGGMFSTPLP